MCCALVAFIGCPSEPEYIHNLQNSLLGYYYNNIVSHAMVEATCIGLTCMGMGAGNLISAYSVTGG